MHADPENPFGQPHSVALWLIEQGIQGASQEDILDGYCSQILADGIPVLRVHVAQRAFHPQFGGIGFDWVKDEGVERALLAHVSSPRAQWLESPLYYLLSQDISEMREPLSKMAEGSRFPFLNELRLRGGTDYFAAKMLFDRPQDSLAVDPNNTPEGLVISWTSDAQAGFSDNDLNKLRGLLPPLGLALKSSSNRQMADDVVATYLGGDAGKRVLSGEIQRGSFEVIQAVIWYFDLRGFTELSEKTRGEDMIAMLNDYFGEVVSIVERHGGNVLKFMGDGLLAIFNWESDANASDAAISAATELRRSIDVLNLRRRAKGQPLADFNLALHSGDVLYGNIGGEARLDFTVIGPAVNTTARILSMCNQLERPLILSAETAASTHAFVDQMVSLGRYMLRGVAKPCELFTIYPDEMG